jgi:hypothetical protein
VATFSAETYQNEYLAAGASEVNAIVTVRCENGGMAEDGAGSAEVVIVDASGSMKGNRIRAAKKATIAAIECIGDGVAFAVIAGTSKARHVYPEDGTMAVASAETRAEAAGAVAWLGGAGGTAIGQWLLAARDLFETVPGTIHHAILLTDGKNQSERQKKLDDAIEQCRGVFQCDCRGVGTDWEVAELRRIATGLLGSVDIVAEPADLEADFRAVIEHAMGRATADVSLRLWTPQGAETAFVRQVAPAIEDLAPEPDPAGPLTVDYPTGAWGEESRDYHLCLRVAPRQVGEEMLAGRVSLVVGEEVVSHALIKALWTDDQVLSTRINREVAHYTGQAELAEAIQGGLEARKEGDERTATVKLGRAVQLAAESGNEDTMRLLEQVVDVDDAAAGTVRLRQHVHDADEMALDTRSTRSVRIQEPAQ